MALVTQLHDELAIFLRYGLGMAFMAFRAILKTGKTFFNIIRPPLVEGLTADAEVSAYSTYIANLLISLKPG